MVRASLSHWLTSVRQLSNGLLDLVYPPACWLCNAALPAGQVDFCPTCEKQLVDDFNQTCPRCALTVGEFTHLEGGCSRCRDQSLPFDAAIRMGLYQGQLREAVLRLKHSSGENVAHALGKLWIRHASDRFHALKVDCLIPVPLHWRRRLERGYNQSATLAAAIAGGLTMPCHSRRLRRIRHTSHQVGKSLAERKSNVHGAFFAQSCPELRGKTIMLVDDVMTTGSTCVEAARALRRAGVARIIVATLARGEYNRGGTF